MKNTAAGDEADDRDDQALGEREPVEARRVGAERLEDAVVASVFDDRRVGGEGDDQAPDGERDADHHPHRDGEGPRHHREVVGLELVAGQHRQAGRARCGPARRGIVGADEHEARGAGERNSWSVAAWVMNTNDDMNMSASRDADDGERPPQHVEPVADLARRGARRAPGRQRSRRQLAGRVPRSGPRARRAARAPTRQVGGDLGVVQLT